MVYDFFPIGSAKQITTIIPGGDLSLRFARYRTRTTRVCRDRIYHARARLRPRVSTIETE